jgi:hypothetical protein
MTTPENIRDLIQAAGLNVQHRCFVCFALLEAYSSPKANPYERWVCGDHGALAHDNGDSDRITRAKKVTV